MADVRDYCDKTHKRLVGIKAGLYDVLGEAEKQLDPSHVKEVKHLKSLVEDIEKSLEELSAYCPADWTPNKKDLDDNMARLSQTLGQMADKLNVTAPDTTAWI